VSRTQCGQCSWCLGPGETPRAVVRLVVPRTVEWTQDNHRRDGEGDSLTPDSDIDSGVFSQESGGGGHRQDTTDLDSDDEERRRCQTLEEQLDEDVEEGNNDDDENEGDDEDEREETEEEEDDENECYMDWISRPKIPFTRKVWNRQNGWYRVRRTSMELRLRVENEKNDGKAKSETGREMRAELAMMRLEIAEMLDDTRELGEEDEERDVENDIDEDEFEESEEDAKFVEEDYDEEEENDEESIRRNFHVHYDSEDLYCFYGNSEDDEVTESGEEEAEDEEEKKSETKPSLRLRSDGLEN